MKIRQEEVIPPGQWGEERPPPAVCVWAEAWAGETVRERHEETEPRPNPGAGGRLGRLSRTWAGIRASEGEAESRAIVSRVTKGPVHRAPGSPHPQPAS